MLRPVPRGGSANLADYITQNNTNMSNLQNADTNLQTQINTNKQSIQGLASGSPKGSYANAAAIVSANPDTGVYIAQDNGHIYSWTKNGSDAIDLGIYQAIGIDESLFLDYALFKKQHSIVNPNKLVYGHWSGTKIDTSYGTQYRTIQKVPISAGHSYWFSRFRILDIYDSNNTRINYITVATTDYTFSSITNGYLICSFYSYDAPIIFDITNWTTDEINNILSYPAYELQENIDLSENMKTWVMGNIPKKMNKLVYHQKTINKYISENNALWKDSDTIDTERYRVYPGESITIDSYYYRKLNFYSLFYNVSGVTRIYTFGPIHPDAETYEKDTITITIPELPADAYYDYFEIFIPNFTRRESSCEAPKVYKNTKLEHPVDESMLNEAVLNLVTEEQIEQAISSVIEKISNSNILYGKKYVACGDSFTHGDFTGYIDSEGHTGTASDAYDSDWGVYKTYPYWIAKRNNMTLINEAVNGSTMTNSDDSPTGRFSYTRYKAIPEDADYITFKFGINDSASHQNMPIGTINDTETNTFYGAWNVVLNWIIENRPKAKLGILIGNGLQGSGHGVQDEEYCVAMRAIAKKFGIPYLDEDLDEQVPLTFRTNKQVDSTIATLRNNQYRVSSTNGHPNLECHKVQSTFVEAFLRRL